MSKRAGPTLPVPLIAGKTKTRAVRLLIADWQRLIDYLGTQIDSSEVADDRVFFGRCLKGFQVSSGVLETQDPRENTRGGRLRNDDDDEEEDD
jgi:hypothetical protein